MKTTIKAMVRGVVLLACGACGGSDPAPSTAASPPPATATGASDATATKPTADAPIANAETVVGEMRDDLRKCYNAGLAKDPKITGQVTVVAKVDAKGAVSTATASDASTLPADVVQCITARIQQAQFAPPGGSGSTLNIPLNFKPSP